MNKVTSSLVKADLIVYLLSGIVLLVGGMYALSQDELSRSGAKNLEAMKVYGGIFLVLVGTAILVLGYIKARDTFNKKK